jgi:hypothetical protein
MIAQLLGQTPVTDQMQHTMSLTWLYWLPLSIVLIVGLVAASGQRREHGPLKQSNEADGSLTLDGSISPQHRLAPLERSGRCGR